MLAQTTLSVVLAHKGSGRHSYHEEIRDLFITFLRRPLELSFFQVAQLDAVCVFGMCLLYVSAPRNANCDMNAAHLEQPQPALFSRRLNNVIHQLIFISQSQPARHLCVPLGWDVTDGLNVTSALSVCVSVFLGIVVYVPSMCMRQMLALRLSVSPGTSPAALVLTCSSGSCSI